MLFILGSLVCFVVGWLFSSPTYFINFDVLNSVLFSVTSLQLQYSTLVVSHVCLGL